MSIEKMTDYEELIELNEMNESGNYHDFNIDDDYKYDIMHNVLIPYKKGIIYMIMCNTTKKAYIGHTIQGLKCRASKHKNDYNRYINGRLNYRTYFEIIYNDNYEHIILEEFNYQERHELFDREALWMHKKKKEGVELVNQILMKKRLSQLVF